MNKSMMTRLACGAVVVGLTAVASGCASPSSAASDAPLADGNELGTDTTIYYGDWTATAYNDLVGDSYYRGLAQFTGPAGTTMKAGACVLRQYKNASGGAQPCSSVADCANAPSTLPSGGSRYCALPDGQWTPTCFYRPGLATTYCAGSPAQGGAPISPGAYYPEAAFAVPNTTWITYACFNGCMGSTSDPATSSAAVVVPTYN